MRTGLALILVALTACSPKEVVKEVPVTRTVTKEVVRYVPIPADLAADCIEVAKKSNTIAEAVRLANARGESIAECTARMRKIRSLGQ